MVDAHGGNIAIVGKHYALMAEDALARGGTSSAEHSIGLTKMGFLARAHGDLVPAMRAIETVLDPRGTLNPGKIFVLS